MASQEKESPQPKLFILPKTASTEARFVTLQNPRTDDANRYYFCPRLGLYEFTKVSAPQTTPRSTLFTVAQDAQPGSIQGTGRNDGKLDKNDSSDPQESDRKSPEEESLSTSIPKGYITKAGELFMATPIDIIFVLLPLLSQCPSNSKNDKQQRLFQPLDDLLESPDNSRLRFILEHSKFRPRLERRMEAICDMVEAGDEKVYRLSEEKLAKELVSKAERMVAKGLPTSLEERFVKRALEIPVLGVSREDSSLSNTTEPEQVSEGETAPSNESQSSVGSTSAPMATSEASASTTMTLPSETPVDENITHLLRLKVALSFIQSSYLPASLSKSVDMVLASGTRPVDFGPLDTHLKHVAFLRAEALASRSLSDFSRKREMDEDEEVLETRAEKKRKKEEEEKRKKAGESRGVRDLKKVNVTGMKKMSDFFGKAAAKKK